MGDVSYEAIKAREKAERQADAAAKQAAQDVVQGLADFFNGKAELTLVPWGVAWKVHFDRINQP